MQSASNYIEKHMKKYKAVMAVLHLINDDY